MKQFSIIRASRNGAAVRLGALALLIAIWTGLMAAWLSTPDAAPTYRVVWHERGQAWIIDSGVSESDCEEWLEVSHLHAVCEEE